MKPWKQVKQVPHTAWFRYIYSKDKTMYRIVKLIYDPAPGVAFVDNHPISLMELATSWEYSHDLKTWRPCSLPMKCPNCESPALGYCVPSEVARDGWFCGRCGAPDRESKNRAPVVSEVVLDPER